MNTYGTSMAKPLDEVRQHTIVPLPNTVTMYRTVPGSMVQSSLVKTCLLGTGTSSIGNPRVEEVHAQVELDTRKEVELKTQTRKFSVYVARSTWDIEAVEIDLRDGR